MVRQYTKRIRKSRLQAESNYLFTQEEELRFALLFPSCASSGMIHQEDICVFFSPFIEAIIAKFPNNIISKERMRNIANRELKIILNATQKSASLKQIFPIIQKQISLQILNYIQKLVA